MIYLRLFISFSLFLCILYIHILYTIFLWKFVMLYWAIRDGRSTICVHVRWRRVCWRRGRRRRRRRPTGSWQRSSVACRWRRLASRTCSSSPATSTRAVSSGIPRTSRIGHVRTVSLLSLSRLMVEKASIRRTIQTILPYSHCKKKKSMFLALTMCTLANIYRNDYLWFVTHEGSGKFRKRFLFCLSWCSCLLSEVAPVSLYKIWFFSIKAFC